MGALKETIRETIRVNNGWIPFAEFQNLALYETESGYYCKIPDDAEQPRVGDRGDFQTSVSRSSSMAKLLAQRCAEIFLQTKTNSTFIEFGGGPGHFVEGFLKAYSEIRGAPSITYTGIEISPYHQREQERRVSHLLPHPGINKFEVKAPGEAFPKDGVYFAHELFDNLPVHLVRNVAGELFEIGVAVEEEGEELRLVESLKPLDNEKAISYLERYDFAPPEGHTVEVPLVAEEFLSETLAKIEKGIFIIIDYGLTFDELRLPERANGTLLCYSAAGQDDRPLENPGEKDITTHVHFDMLADVAHAAGWEASPLMRQADFLMKMGIMDKAQDFLPRDQVTPESVAQNRAIAELLSPTGWGAGMRVLVLTKSISSKSFLNSMY